MPRRQFLRTSAGAVAAGTFATPHLLGQDDAGSNEEGKKLGVALVGLGVLSTGQLGPAFKETKHCKLTGLVTGSRDKAKKWSEQYGIDEKNVYNYENFEKIADNPEIDIIYIVLPNSMHAEYTIRAAKIKKHVLCEKPMANSVADCEAMIAACKENGVKLAIGYRCQFEPHHIECMRLAKEKEYGAVKLIDAGFGFRAGDPAKHSHVRWRLNKKMAGGGALMDVGVYALQACRYLTGEEPTEVFAMETKTDPVKFAEVDESIDWTMRFPSGVMANCSTTYSVSGMNRFKALAEKGWFGLEPAYSYGGIKGQSKNGDWSVETFNQFAAEMDDFALCVKEGRESRVAGEDGLKDMRVVEAIYESIAKGAKVKVVS
ncbi:MAG: Gfo/Idh/MocA family oxidoreductase [Verrucomicrobiota bacterium]